MAQISAAWDPGNYITGQASATLVGGRCVQASAGIVTATTGGRVPVGLPSAAANILGVAMHDAVSGGDVNVLRGISVLVRIETSAIITANTLVKAAADGTIIPQGGTGVAIGKALEDAASGARCLVDRQQTAL